MKINKLLSVRKYGIFALLASATLLISCSDDEAPEAENEEEVVTDIKLVFTNDSDANDVVTASAKDPDGIGVKELEVLSGITLKSGVTYTLTYEITNALDPNDVEDITEEIKDEDFDHQIFYAFTDGAFTSPTGDGNIDTASDAMNYLDEDKNGNVVGLMTKWTTGDALTGGKFQIKLQHQPDGIKTATSGSGDGDTDFDLEFDLTIE